MAAPGRKDGDGADPPAIIVDTDAPDAAKAERPGPEYTALPPSIEADHPREPIELPDWAAPAPRRPKAPPAWRRPALLVGAGLLLAVGAWSARDRLRTPPPVITSIVPTKAEPGQTVTIAGSGLGSDVADTVVRFGDRRGVATSATGTSLSATIPAELASVPAGDLALTVEVGGVRSNPLFMTLARFPRVTAVEPEVALPGDEVTLRGANLDSANMAVRIGGMTAIIVGPGRDAVRVKVPDLPASEGREAPVEVAAGRDSARPGKLILGHLPLALALDPDTAEAGSIVAVKGYGFPASPAEARVTFGGADAIVVASSPREIKAAVPASGLMASRQAVPVVVFAGDRRSSPLELAVVKASGDVFRPRFAAAPLPGGERDRPVVVGTEIGPVLLLTGRGEAARAADRAVAVASRLNTLMQAAASQPVRVETRETAVVSGPTTILTVAEEDAETLSRGVGGVSGARITPRRLAEYWAALLDDYLGLFGQRRRPIRTLEMSPRARVLLEIYADAERRGGSAGVSARIAADLSSDRLEALRQLAYAAPADGGGARGLALAGAWEGTMEDQGASRPIRLQIRADGDRLSGILASSAGDIAMGIPLGDLRYDRSMVRFDVVLGGATRQFQGTLEGATLSGSIHHDGGPPAGRFTLRHVE